MPTVSTTTIQELIISGRIVEARALLAVDGSTLPPEERDTLLLEIDKRASQADALIAQAELMEQEGRNEEAKALYASVLAIAVDYPGIDEHIKRMDEALFLARAVQRRNKRIRETVSHKDNKKRNWLLPVLGTGLVAGLAAAALILVVNKPASPPAGSHEPAPPHNPVTASAQQTADPPTPVRSADTLPSATTSSQLSQQMPTPTSSADPQPRVTHVAEEPQAAEPTPPAATPTPAATPATPPPVEALAPSATLPPASQSPSAQNDYYTVQPGDSLSQIAEHQLCHEPSWRALYHLNQDRIADPRKLQPGMQLRLNGLERRCPARP